MVSIALTDSSDSIHGTVADSIDDIGSYLYYQNCRLELSIRSEQSAMAIDIVDAITDIVTSLSKREHDSPRCCKVLYADKFGPIRCQDSFDVILLLVIPGILLCKTTLFTSMCC